MAFLRGSLSEDRLAQAAEAARGYREWLGMSMEQRQAYANELHPPESHALTEAELAAIPTARDGFEA